MRKTRIRSIKRRGRSIKRRGRSIKRRMRGGGCASDCDRTTKEVGAYRSCLMDECGFTQSEAEDY
jgi:hypothetical protein